MSKCLVIAEAGVNHNGSVELAHQLVDAAHAAGADVVKFQTFKAKKLVTASATQADYQSRNTGKAESQLAMLTRLELSHDAHLDLIRHCKDLGIAFLSTAFDDESLEFLTRDIQLQLLKVPSGELTNAPFVLEHARTGCELIVSTGMATLADVEAALGVIAYGLLPPDDGSVPTLSDFAAAYASEQGQAKLQEKVTLLHCTTEYPTPLHEVNLNAMRTMRETFKLPVGYSDHTAGIHVSVAAAAMGATVIEKHFTLDKGMEGPDHKASLDPAELAALVAGVREVTQSLGNGLKFPQTSEIKNMAVARKSLVAARAIAKGEAFTEDNMTVMRPGTGVSPYRYWEFLGKQAGRDYQPGDLLNA